MNFSRQLVRLRQAVVCVGRTDASATCTIRPFATTVISPPNTGNPQQQQQTQQQQSMSKRFFAAPSVAASTPPPPSAIKYDELVKETIKKMIMDREPPEAKPISNAELEARFNRYKKVFEEAELCLIDLQDATGAEDYAEECACARGAVENAFTAYVDLLEDLRRANEEQLHSYSEVRNSNACNLKRLRQQLDALLVAQGKVV